MTRRAIGVVLVAAMVAVAMVVAAQDSGEGEQPKLVERPAIHQPGPGPGGGPPHGPGGGPHHLRGPRSELSRLEREYAEELRRVRTEVGELQRKLDENGQELRSLWDKAEDATAEERQAMRPELERLANERGAIELKIAERQAAVAQKGFEVALERLVQAKVQLHETQIKVERLKQWLKGEWGKRLRERRPGMLRDFRERRRNEEEGPSEEPAEPPADEEPAEPPADDTPEESEE